MDTSAYLWTVSGAPPSSYVTRVGLPQTRAASLAVQIHKNIANRFLISSSFFVGFVLQFIYLIKYLNSAYKNGLWNWISSNTLFRFQKSYNLHYTNRSTPYKSNGALLRIRTRYLFGRTMYDATYKTMNVVDHTNIFRKLILMKYRDLTTCRDTPH